MKKAKGIIFGIVLLIVSLVLITTSNAAFTMSMSIGGNTNVKVGETVVVTINLTEEIVACNFDVIYNQSIFEFIGSETTGLSAAVNGTKVSCIYYDASLTGTNILKLKFKALKETTEVSNFSLSNAKFRAKGKEESYIGSQIIGVDSVLQVTSVTSNQDKNQVPDNNGIEEAGTNGGSNSNSSGSLTPDKNVTSDGNKVSKETEKGKIISTGKTTTATKSTLPNTGLKENIGYVLLVCSILIILSTVFKMKERNLNKIFKAGGLMLVIIAVLTMTPNVNADNSSETKILFYNTLIPNTNNVTIAIGDCSRSIIKSEVKALNKNITDIVKENDISLLDDEKVRTGDKVKVGETEYIVILYGDANGDGDCYDTDDIMCIVGDYLGTAPLTGEKKIAANLTNNDNLLDSDDIMQMINLYIGNVKDIVVEVPETNIDISQGDNQDNENLKFPFKSGDYIKYNIDYTNVKTYYWPSNPSVEAGGTATDTGWRVAYNTNDEVKIITAGVPERVLLSDNKKTKEYYLDNSNFQKYSNELSKNVIGALTIDEIKKYKIDWLEYGNDNSPIICIVLGEDLFSTNDGLYYYNNNIDKKFTFAGSGVEVGIRPVVTLKDNIRVIGGDGSKSNPWTIEIN